MLALQANFYHYFPAIGLSGLLTVLITDPFGSTSGIEGDRIACLPAPGSLRYPSIGILGRSSVRLSYGPCYRSPVRLIPLVNGLSVRSYGVRPYPSSVVTTFRFFKRITEFSP